jgi:hypothetical protein
MDLPALARARRTLRARRWTIAAIAHTHPDAPAVPGRRDLAGHPAPEIPMLILSLARKPPAVRAWRVCGASASEIDVCVDGQESESRSRESEFRSQNPESRISAADSLDFFSAFCIL